MKTNIQQKNQAHRGVGVLVLALLSFSACSALGQVANQITLVDPNTADQGTAGLLVTFTLDTDEPPAPPAGEMPDSVMIGSLSGTSVTHSSQYIVTAVFSGAGTAAYPQCVH